MFFKIAVSLALLLISVSLFMIAMYMRRHPSGLSKPPCTVEPASPEECAEIEERVREYHENPASFVSWRKVRRETGAAESL
jgi:hypothetical protein